ncbi:MAG: ribosome-associated translation inhibitor RaiA [Fibrobacter sp.]|nr:ribosome-associated translation inhibitor RaiA [Fibrobacter sp.]
MNIQVSARHFNASESLQLRVQEEAERLQRFYPNITEVSIVLDAERKNSRKVDMVVKIRQQTIKATAKEENMGKAIDVAFERVERQLKRENQKQKTYRGEPLSSVAVDI